MLSEEFCYETRHLSLKRQVTFYDHCCLCIVAYAWSDCTYLHCNYNMVLSGKSSLSSSWRKRVLDARWILGGEKVMKPQCFSISFWEGGVFGSFSEAVCSSWILFTFSFKTRQRNSNMKNIKEAQENHEIDHPVVIKAVHIHEIWKTPRMSPNEFPTGKKNRN